MKVNPEMVRDGGGAVNKKIQAFFEENDQIEIRTLLGADPLLYMLQRSHRPTALHLPTEMLKLWLAAGWITRSKLGTYRFVRCQGCGSAGYKLYNKFCSDCVARAEESPNSRADLLKKLLQAEFILVDDGNNWRAVNWLGISIDLDLSCWASAIAIALAKYTELEEQMWTKGKVYKWKAPVKPKRKTK